jgi:hypothetical protein
LGAAAKKKDFGLGQVASFGNPLSGRDAIVIAPVTGKLEHIRIDETFEDGGMATFGIVIAECEHRESPFTVKSIASGRRVALKELRFFAFFGSKYEFKEKDAPFKEHP